MNETNKNRDFYSTIKGQNRDEVKIKKSRFIATAANVDSKEDAMKFLEKIKLEFYDASHNCFSYRIGPGGLDFRAADDGEPAGSAGKPILFAIKKFGLSDVIVVVTRFFGGTKLGIGGLARAYSEAAVKVLSGCTKDIVHLTIPVKIFCTYQDVSAVKRLVAATAVQFDEHYADAVEFTARIHKSKVDSFTASITSATAGRAGTVVM